MSANHDARPPADATAEQVRGTDDPFAAQLLRQLGSVDDLSSGSDEVAGLCRDRTIGYHLSASRANVLRDLPLPADSAVLELGAAGGAVTRHLGEMYASVDAVEPDAGLAAVAATRCRDLPTVSVHVGWLDVLDPHRRYDVIVALDVLAEVQRRGDDLAAVVDWCHSHLTPRGVLVLGADNADGVRALAGSATPRRRPDDLGRPPRLTRDELESAVRASGLVPTVLSAFPDHRDARVLFDHAALEALDPHLLSVLPSFPSPPYDGEPSSVHEGALWSAAIAAGTAAGAANSLVVLAAPTTSPVQPAAVATYWSQGRRAALSATNSIVAGADGAVVQRAHAFPGAVPPDGPLRLRPHTEPLLHGTPLSRLLSQTADLATAADLLRSWAAMVTAATPPGSTVPWDLIPRNVMVTSEGELAVFDQEWEHEPTPRATDLVLQRGAFWLAHDLLTTHGRPDWLRGDTVGATADFILRLVRPSAAGAWLDSFAIDESTAMSHIWPEPHGHNRLFTARREWKNVTSLSNSPTPPQTGSAGAADLREVVDSLSQANADLRAENDALRLELRHTALVHRDDTMGLVASAEALRDRLERAHVRNRRQKARITALQAQLTALKASRTWRVGRAVLRPFSKLSRVVGR